MRVYRGRTRRRSGAVLVELAVVYPILFFILLALILGATAIFRYQQVAQAAREGSRWAAVHGTTYSTEQTTAATAEADVYTNAIRPQMVSADLTKVGYTVSWPYGQKPASTRVINDQNVYVNNTVTVTVTYLWDLGILGPVTLQSSSTSNMFY